MTKGHDLRLLRPRAQSIINVALRRVLGSVVLVLLGLELSLRLLVSSPISQVVYDADLGVVPAPNTEIVRGTEGFGITHYVAAGEVYTPASTPNGPSIAVLGDSHTEAVQVNDAEKYPAVAAALLQQAGTPANFHNIAQSGSSAADFVYLATFVQAKLQPQVVVIQVGVQSFYRRQRL